MSQINKYDLDELRRHIRALMLCGDSQLNHAVDTLIHCYRMSQPLEIAGIQNHGGALFLEIAKKLGVTISTSAVNLIDENYTRSWLDSTLTSNFRTFIPPLKNRSQDYYLILPYCFELVLSTLRAIEPVFRTPQIQSLYLALLCNDLANGDLLSFLNRLKRDLIRAEPSELLKIQIQDNSYLREGEVVGKHLVPYSDASLLMLGFCRGGSNLEDLMPNGLDSEFLLGPDRSILLTEKSEPDNSSIYLVSHFEWSTGQLQGLLRNVDGLNNYFGTFSPQLQSEVMTCLRMGLQGATDLEIARQIGLNSERALIGWKLKNFMHISDKSERTVVDAWNEAREFLGVVEPVSPISLVPIEFWPRQQLVPGLGGVPQLMNVIDQPVKKTVKGFLAGDGYTEIRAKSGAEFTLTPRQSQVIQMLHEAQKGGLNGWISQARVIQEVYGDAKTSNLRKLFGDNLAFQELVESGERRGTVRLRT